MKKDIERAVRHITAKDYNNPKTDAEIQDIIDTVINSYENQQYDFSTYSSMLLNQGNKKRTVKYYDDIYSTENVLCQCVKQILDRTFNIKYPNRNKTIKRLFSHLSATIQMTHFTILKFDFKDYYNSVSASYVFEKCIKNELSQREDYCLLSNYCNSVKYAYAGLCTSNAISEIIAKTFDSLIIKEFSSRGLLFYERYIDDCILLLNEYLDYDEIQRIIEGILKDTYYLKFENDIYACKTSFNYSKFQYISSKTLSTSHTSFDYLGYEFWLFRNARSKVCIEYGITEEKRRKYIKRVNRIISYYNDPSSPDYHDLELLRHRIRAFASREVYISKYYKTDVCKN